MLGGVVFIFGLVAMVNNACACSCFPESTKKLFCDADYMVEVRVLSELINENNQQDFDDYFRVVVLSQLKMQANESVDMTRVYTGSNGALCGVYLENGAEYYIGGDISRGNRMTLDMCHSIIMQRNENGKVPKLIRKPPTCRKKNQYQMYFRKTQ